MSTRRDAPRSEPPQPGPRTRPTPRRRRRAVGAVAAFALVVAVVTAVVLAGGGLRGSTAPEPVVLPTPTPTVEPVNRGTTTDFQRALPDAVLAFVVADQVEDPGLLDAGAVEAYTLTYTDGSREVILRTGQWPTVQAVTEAMTTLVAEAGQDPGARRSDAPTPPTAADGTAPPPSASRGAVVVRDAPVLVDGTEVGRVIIWGDPDSALAVWHNGPTLFALTGPGDVVPALYDAFPM